MHGANDRFNAGLCRGSFWAENYAAAAQDFVKRHFWSLPVIVVGVRPLWKRSGEECFRQQACLGSVEAVAVSHLPPLA
eukprot:scaffold6655_cov115-Pinguiococcus_pyrenoidosus.AAC.1